MLREWREILLKIIDLKWPNKLMRSFAFKIISNQQKLLLNLNLNLCKIWPISHNWPTFQGVSVIWRTLNIESHWAFFMMQKNFFCLFSEWAENRTIFQSKRQISKANDIVTLRNKRTFIEILIWHEAIRLWWLISWILKLLKARLTYVFDKFSINKSERWRIERREMRFLDY